MLEAGLVLVHFSSAQHVPGFLVHSSLSMPDLLQTTGMGKVLHMLSNIPPLLLLDPVVGLVPVVAVVAVVAAVAVVWAWLSSGIEVQAATRRALQSIAMAKVWAI